MRAYEGAGGTGESAGADQTLYSFYTPEPVIEKMWQIARAFVPPGAQVLDPAAGSGRFAAQGREFAVDQIEPDGLAARINQILNPDTTVMRGVFQDLFRDPDRNREIPYKGKAYDLVIGNPPYGTYSGRDRQIIGKEHKRYESLFIERGLDTLKPGGLMVMLVPRGFLDNSDEKILGQIAAKGKLLEAYRLPNGIFPTTDVGTDIVVIRKEPGAAADFQSYFERNPDRVLGTYSKTKTDRYGRPLLGGTLKELDRIQVQNPGPATAAPDEGARGSALMGNQNARGHRGKTGRREPAAVTKNIVSAPAQRLSATEFNAKYNSQYSDADRETLKHTRFDGSFDHERVPFNSELHSFQSGRYYHDVLYASGDIYAKLDALERQKETIIERHGQAQYAKQRALLEQARPAPKPVSEYHISPISGFVQKTFKFADSSNLIDQFIAWARIERGDWSKANISRQELGSAIAWSDVLDYLLREPVRGLTSEDPTKRETARRVQSQRRETAEKLFRRFLNEGLDGEKKKLLEDACNRLYNAAVDPDFARIPTTVDGLSTVYRGREVQVQDHQLRAIKFLNLKGSGVIAYGTGLGKTFAGLMATVQNMQMGRCRRPLIIVPRAVYSQWTNEIKSRFPDLNVNELGNLGVTSGFDPAAGVPENSLSIMTYEGLQALSYSPDDLKDLTGDLQDALSTAGIEQQTQFKAAQEGEKIAALAGRGQKGARTGFDVDKLGFDHVTVDESHNFKNLIEKVRTRKEKGANREANEFADITGATSDRAARLFLLTQFVQKRNNGRNVFLLSATPFTNSPIEIYSMLQYVARDELRALGLSNVNEFLSAFAELKNDWVVKPGGKVVRKDVVKSFQNVGVLQDLIRRNMDFLSARDLGGKIDVPEKSQHVVKLAPTPVQRDLLLTGESIVSANKKPGDALRGIALMRQATLSPAQADPDGKHDFVRDSPKISFACDVVTNVYKERPDVGHILYLPEGKDFFPDIQKYLKAQGLPAGAVRVIEGGTKLEIRDEIKNSFNDPAGEVKVLIGTRAIMEGMDLNGCTATTFDLHLPWNPSEKIQLEGRACRQGNRLERTHMLTPVLLDSADSAMLQKHDEKGSRFNDLMSYRGGNTMSVEGISPEELKFELIKNPEKLADWMMARESENQVAEAASLKAAAENMRGWAKQDRDAEQAVAYDQGTYIPRLRERLGQATERLRAVQDRASTGWALEEAERSVRSIRAEIKKTNEEIEHMENLRRRVRRNAEDRGITVADLEGEAAELDKKAEKLESRISGIKNNREKFIADAKQQIAARSEKAPDLEEQIQKYSRLLIDDVNAQKMKQKSFFQWFMERLAA